MHFVIFGLSVSSSWGNGHATIWRGLLKAMAAAGHTATFYERDVPYYASARDVWESPFGVRLRIYQSLDEIQAEAAAEINCADVAICTSYCPDGIPASRLILDSHAAVRAFYDLDTPVTLDALQAGKPVPYLPPEGLSGFDLVLSYTGGRALDELRSRLGARLVAPLYGAVDPDVHAPAAPREEFRSALSYLGTYAEDRQRALEELFVQPARQRAHLRFALGGAQYPHDFPWTSNIFFVRHLPPSLHPAFFSSSRMTLNVTRRAMAEYGFCPSGRLFEAAACGTPILTDGWEGLDAFFKPGKEILRVDTAADVLGALDMPDSELANMAAAARQRTLREHTASQRVAQLEAICEGVAGGQTPLALTA
ncbi:MAG TPA: glycosyltransferase [Terracidiphilus sp.]